jgi:hypothetical protein
MEELKMQIKQVKSSELFMRQGSSQVNMTQVVYTTQNSHKRQKEFCKAKVASQNTGNEWAFQLNIITDSNRR